MKPGIPYAASLGAEGRPRLALRKGTLAAADPKLAYAVKTSATLGADSWSVEDTAILADTPEELIVEYTGPSPFIFFRLELSLAP